MQNKGQHGAVIPFLIFFHKNLEFAAECWVHYLQELWALIE